jgi:predicted P-loop ATPase/GTPase
MPPDLNKIEQPGAQDPKMSHIKRYHAGSERSQKRLEELNYDPIGELVQQYHDICKLIQQELDWKEGREERVNMQGKVRVFHHDFLDKLLDKKERIADKLLRYGYGRVPEVVAEEKSAVPAFQVITSKGQPIRHLSAPKSDEE